MQVLALPVHGANDLQPAFHTATRESVAGLMVFADPFFLSQREQIVALAAEGPLPALPTLATSPVAGVWDLAADQVVRAGPAYIRSVVEVMAESQFQAIHQEQHA